MQSSEDCEADDVAGAALIGAHAEGGVTFQMLHRVIALALGESEILGGDVVLQIDEALAAASAGERHRPQRFQWRLGEVVTTRCAGTGRRREARHARRFCPRLLAFAQAIAEGEAAPRRACRALCLTGLVGHEARNALVVAELSLGLGEQMHGGVPAARHAQQIAVDALRIAAHPVTAVGKGHDLDPGEALLAERAHHRGSGHQLDTGGIDDLTGGTARPRRSHIHHR